jgi:tRNA wybutosine-synthesizing protein 2
MIENLVSLIVPQQRVKLIKSALEKRGQLSRASRIRPVPEEGDVKSGSSARFLVPTTISTSKFARLEGIPGEALGNILKEIFLDLGLEISLDSISILLSAPPDSGNHFEDTPRKPLHAAISTWLQTLPKTLLSSLSLTNPSLISSFPSTYSVYKPLLLLPPHAFRAGPWTTLLSFLGNQDLEHKKYPDHLYASLAAAVDTTHIAINAPIPPQNSTADNILRSPVALTPLYGSFGPPPSTESQSAPSVTDFREALWVSVRQNGITQIWAPLYTMFSRGNIVEKARLLALPVMIESVTRSGSESGAADGGCTAVDLYAGIGYFAFSYRKAGVEKVLCWELNPWSVEGLVRGAGMNGWSAVRMGVATDANDMDMGTETAEADFLIFQESNELASGRIEQLRATIPPIQHVNCGLLPSSRGSWRTAVRAVDLVLGGWVHLHENLAVGEIGRKAKEIVQEIWRLAEEEGRGIVRFEHVERVKTYAPGVMHCVLDIWIGPIKES